MKENIITLNKLGKGKSAIIRSLSSNGKIRRRMLDLGLVINTKIKALHKSPSGDPVAYLIRESVIALRGDESSKILIQELEGGF